MKTKVVATMIFSLILMRGYSQNRINEWDTDKITSIHIEYKTSENLTEVLDFNQKETMDTLFSFLSRIDFKIIENHNFNKPAVLDQWFIKMTFQGQQDQIIFCRDIAAIGKTMFSIDNKVIRDFSLFFQNL